MSAKEAESEREWFDKANYVIEYARNHGNTAFPEDFTYTSPSGVSTNMRLFLASIIGLRRSKKLKENREQFIQKELIDTGYMEWERKYDTDADQWRRKYDALVKIGEETGNCNIELNHCCSVGGKEGVKLGIWLNLQRQDYQKKKLSADRVQLLNTLADKGIFSWTSNETLPPDPTTGSLSQDDWNIKFRGLCDYIEEFGHSNVPDLYRAELENGSSVLLNRWISRQKKLQMMATLRPDREARIQELVDSGKVQWDKRRYTLPNEPSWATCMKMLEVYAAEHGTYNCRQDSIVKLKDKLFPLGIWLNVQRAAYRARRLPSDQEAMLQELVDAKQMVWTHSDEIGGSGMAPSTYVDDDETVPTSSGMGTSSNMGSGMGYTVVAVEGSDSDSEADEGPMPQQSTASSSSHGGGGGGGSMSSSSSPIPHKMTIPSAVKGKSRRAALPTAIIGNNSHLRTRPIIPPPPPLLSLLVGDHQYGHHGNGQSNSQSSEPSNQKKQRLA